MVYFKETIIFQGSRGVPTFCREGPPISRGSNCLFPIETQITCGFPWGGPDSCPPSGSAHVLKSWLLIFWSRGGCSPVKLFATGLLHLSFPLMWNVTWPWSEKLTFRLPGTGVWVCRGLGSAGKIFAIMLLHSWFHLIWYATKSWNLIFWPPGTLGSPGKIFAVMLLHSWLHLIWYASWQLNFDLLTF